MNEFHSQGRYTMTLINIYTARWIILRSVYYVNSLYYNLHLILSLAVESEVNTLTETSLAGVPFNTLTTALTLLAFSFTKYSVMLNPIKTPERGNK